MQDFYLFEAGSTKTDLIYIKDGERNESALPGFNPNRECPDFHNALSKYEIADVARVFFYGSGLGNNQNKEVVREIFSYLDSGRVRVYDDILGAGRAAFNTLPGIICIMGTGGLAAYYDGMEIVKRRGGYGYLVNDLGGGLELGRAIITAWLNGDLSEAVTEELKSHTSADEKEIIKNVYSTKSLDLVASLAKLVSEIEDESIKNVIDKYFDRFFDENVMPLSTKFEVSNFSIIGSLGTGFYKQIRSVSKRKNLHLEQCVQSPVQRLFDYHLQKA